MAQLGGKAEIALNGVIIPASILSEVTVDISEGTRERATLGGKFTRPSGVLDAAEAKFTLFLPSMDYLKNIFPDRYNAPTGNTTGNVIYNSETCVETTTGPLNIHFTCEDNDANDIYFYNGMAHLNFSATYNASDDISIEVTIYAQPDSDGNVVRLGTGDLTQEAIYNEATDSSDPVAS